MARIFKLFGMSLVLGTWLMGAFAQDVEPGEMMRGGLQVIRMIDEAKAGDLWDGAAAAARKKVGRAEFVAQVGKSRGPLGLPQQRAWVSINRQVIVSEDPDIAGQYVSIEYETRFAGNSAASVRELVSFHLDRDRVWRFTGYVVR